MKLWMSRKFVQFWNTTFVEPMHQRQLVELKVPLEKVQLVTAQNRFGLRNFVLGISARKLNHAKGPNLK